MNPSNLSLRQKSRGTVVKTIAIHLYGARDPNYIVDPLSQVGGVWERVSAPDPHVTPAGSGNEWRSGKASSGRCGPARLGGV